MFSPVSESAFCGAGVLHVMLAHTDSAGVLHVLRGVPLGDTQWANITFHLLRTSQALLVSAARWSGQTAFVRLQATASGPPQNYSVVVHDPAWADVGSNLQHLPSTVPVWPAGPAGSGFTVQLAEGEHVLLFLPGTQRFVIEAAPAADPSAMNAFGFTPGKLLPLLH
jgi:hypothetical protein